MPELVLRGRVPLLLNRPSRLLRAVEGEISPLAPFCLLRERPQYRSSVIADPAECYGDRCVCPEVVESCSRVYWCVMSAESPHCRNTMPRRTLLLAATGTAAVALPLLGSCASDEPPSPQSILAP